MNLGIDLDNTLVCYDRLFWQLANERGLIDATVPCRKERVRDELRRTGRESDWTLLQGEVYGPRMIDAEAFPGALAALNHFRELGWSVCIISHRTRKPIMGPEWDLHGAARHWLTAQGFLDERSTGLNQERVYLETEKAAKLARIEASHCAWFIDDLPELLTDARFPIGIRRLLFDPHGHSPALPDDVATMNNWNQAASLLQGTAS